MATSGEIAIRYHERTKHHFHRHARSLGYLDWATQPDPFRRFASAPLIELPFRGEGGDGPAYDDLFASTGIAKQPWNVQAVASLFELSLGISAWKQYQGSRWALRINPSSGNLHPTEGYLVAGPVAGMSDQPGVYHYAPREHVLERRAVLAADRWEKFFADITTGLGDGVPAAQCLFVALTSIHWREAWKYGERAYRYCQEDAGHALAAVALSAAINGWHCRLMEGVSDASLSKLLGLDRAEDFDSAEHEHPDLLLVISPDGALAHHLAHRVIDVESIRELSAHAEWTGKANRLSSDHVQWDAIDEVAAACIKPESAGVRATTDMSASTARTRTQDVRAKSGSLSDLQTAQSAVQIIRQRRSAVDFDGQTPLPAVRFFTMLERIMPDGGLLGSAMGTPVSIHLGLFVHRVTGLEPGLYCLPRTPAAELMLREAMHRRFLWQRPTSRPPDIPLFLLERGDATSRAAQVSCGQAIAGDSAFSLGFLAEFAVPLREHGDWFYRRLFWEAGAIAQVLYLEAEAAALRGTGIGCFYDDPVHDVFGLSGNAIQSLYHFTLGGPVEDTRLTTLPPYPSAMVQARSHGHG